MKNRLIEILILALGAFSFLFAFISTTYAVFIQAILRFSGEELIFGMFVSHPSAWWFLGILGFIPALIIYSN